MSGRFSDRADFEIPSDLIDEHEWVSDAFIDGPFGYDCILAYPPSDSECPNCLYDPDSARSANIYKIGGPAPFPNHTVCPWCGGVGKLSIPITDNIRLRVYWGGMEVNAAMRQFKMLNSSKFVDGPAGLLFVIGYMDDLQKFARCDLIIVNSNIDKQEIRCGRASECVPWGFRKNRYFACMLERQ